MNDKTERQLREIQELKERLKKITGDFLHQASRQNDPLILEEYRKALIGLNGEIALCVPQVLWHENSMKQKFNMGKAPHTTWEELLLG